MKYYAVTEDPNELLHYGRLGMKWGKHIFGDKPRSSGYKRALGKLKASVNKTKSSIQKSSAQRAITKQNKQQERYAKAVQKAQNRVNIIEGMNSLNKLQNYEKKVEQDYKAQRNAEKAAMKQAKQYAKNEKRMQKYTQQAREGRLRYGKLSDDQVRQITDRLALERSARSLGNTEKASYGYRKREAIREGKLEGYRRGTAAGMEEVGRGLVQLGFASRAILNTQAKQKAKREHDANRIRNRRSEREMREDFRNEVYEEKMRNGKVFGTKKAAKELQKLNDAENERQWKLDQEHKTLDSERQDRLNAARTERELQEKGRLAYEYGYLPSGNKQGGGNKNQQQNQNGGQGKKNGGGNNQQNSNIDEMANYYKLRYVDKETLQQKAAREKEAADKVQKRLNAEDERREERLERRIGQMEKATKRNKATNARIDAMIALGAKDQQKSRNDYINKQLKQYAEKQRKLTSDPYMKTGKVSTTNVGNISGNYDPDDLFGFKNKNKYNYR